MDLLYQHAADLGLDVCWSDMGEYRRGQYADGVVWLNPRMTRRQATSTLAHEIGHAVFGDGCSTPALERRAWEYGAALIISPGEYARAERCVGHHLSALAIELDVTPKLIEAWRRWYEKRFPVEVRLSLADK